MKPTTLYHNLVDLHQRRTYPAAIDIQDGTIIRIEPTDKPCTHYILPGFVDAHVHIESSLLLPSAFARLAVRHGTVATVSDPHEIANVCGMDGVRYMLRNAARVPFKFHFGAPSCVPATAFETAGAVLGPEEVDMLLQDEQIYYLSEMMNYPGVLQHQPDVMQKIALARKYGKPVDGHAPGLKGDLARRYIEAGIQTDHECVNMEEALDKVRYGMKILIREGSAARNLDALLDLLDHYPDQVMFCCDDQHPDRLMEHHINDHVKRALAKGKNLYDVLRAASVNPVMHYHLPVGLLREGDEADYIVVDDLDKLTVLQTVIRGELVFSDGHVSLPHLDEEPINQFSCILPSLDEFACLAPAFPFRLRVIEALNGQLLTQTYYTTPLIREGKVLANPDADILKIVVVNRYRKAAVAKGFIKNVGLKQGAFASSVAHDSHNLIAVGADDKSIQEALAALIPHGGGLSFSLHGNTDVLPLPVAGLMSLQSGEEVAEAYTRIHQAVIHAGSTLAAPYMTLSFMALLVIPALKLSDLGLFDGEDFSFTSWADPIEVS